MCGWEMCCSKRRNVWEGNLMKEGNFEGEEWRKDITEWWSKFNKRKKITKKKQNKKKKKENTRACFG